MQPRILFSLIFVVLAFPSGVDGQDSKVPPTDKESALASASAEIRESIEAYVTAFNAQDVPGLSVMWTPDAVYTNRSSDERLMGRDAILGQFKEILSDKEASPKLAVTTESIEFVSPSVAIERGNAVVSRGDDDATESAYSAVYVKKNDKWLIDRITEEDIVVEPSHYEKLKGLKWLIGDWIDAGEGFSIETTCKWTEKQNFISRTYSVATPEEFASSGLQIIGWDAAEKTIRSWLFDSDGGFVTGTWTQRDDQWVVQSVATLADGARGSFTSIFKPTEDGRYTWQKINRVRDGRLLPNIDEVIIQRK